MSDSVKAEWLKKTFNFDVNAYERLDLGTDAGQGPETGGAAAAGSSQPAAYLAEGQEEAGTGGPYNDLGAEAASKESASYLTDPVGDDANPNIYATQAYGKEDENLYVAQMDVKPEGGISVEQPPAPAAEAPPSAPSQQDGAAKEKRPLSAEQGAAINRLLTLGKQVNDLLASRAKADLKRNKDQGRYADIAERIIDLVDDAANEVDAAENAKPGSTGKLAVTLFKATEQLHTASQMAGPLPSALPTLPKLGKASETYNKTVPPLLAEAQKLAESMGSSGGDMDGGDLVRSIQAVDAGGIKQLAAMKQSLLDSLASNRPAATSGMAALLSGPKIGDDRLPAAPTGEVWDEQADQQAHDDASQAQEDSARAQDRKDRFAKMTPEQAQKAKDADRKAFEKTIAEAGANTLESLVGDPQSLMKDWEDHHHEKFSKDDLAKWLDGIVDHANDVLDTRKKEDDAFLAYEHKLQNASAADLQKIIDNPNDVLGKWQDFTDDKDGKTRVENWFNQFLSVLPDMLKQRQKEEEHASSDEGKAGEPLDPTIEERMAADKASRRQGATAQRAEIAGGATPADAKQAKGVALSLYELIKSLHETLDAFLPLQSAREEKRANIQDGARSAIMAIRQGIETAKAQQQTGTVKKGLADLAALEACFLPLARGVFDPHAARDMPAPGTLSALDGQLALGLDAGAIDRASQTLRLAAGLFGDSEGRDAETAAWDKLADPDSRLEPKTLATMQQRLTSILKTKDPVVEKLRGKIEAALTGPIPGFAQLTSASITTYDKDIKLI